MSGRGGAGAGARRCGLLLALGLVFSLSRASVANPGLADALGSDAGHVLAGGETIRALVAVKRFYQRRSFRPAWTTAGGGPLLADLSAAIDGAAGHGLTPADYHRDAIAAAVALGDDLAVELLATDAFLTLGAHLVGGRVDPVSVEPDWTAARRERDLAAHLEAVLASGRVATGCAGPGCSNPLPTPTCSTSMSKRQWPRSSAGWGWSPMASSAPSPCAS